MVLFSHYPGDPRPRRAAEALAAAGMSVDLICLRETRDDPKHEAAGGVRVRRLPIRRRRAGTLGYLYRYSAFILAASAILAARMPARRYDLVYVHNMPDVLVLAGLAPKLFGARMILDLHDPMPELMMTIFGLPEGARSVGILKRLEKWSIRLADRVVTVNRACAQLFASRSCTPERVTVIMNSPDEEIFEPRAPRLLTETRDASRPFVVMYHGSLVERNGLDLAVDALDRLGGTIPELELRVYGAPNAYLDRVMDSARSRGLDGRIRYLGPKPSEEIAEAIEACDVGIIPNRRNIFTELNTPTRIFEYLAMGKPVIAPRSPGICDYFDEDSLVFFELGSAEDLARKIDFVFQHPNEAAETTRRGREVHRSHTWNEERARLTALVADLLEPKGSGAAHLKHP